LKIFGATSGIRGKLPSSPPPLATRLTTTERMDVFLTEQYINSPAL